MMEFDKRQKPDGLQQKYTRVRPVQFEGSKPLEHREGGAYPLYVQEAQPGLFLSCWMVDAEYCRKFMEEVKGEGHEVVLSLVVDTNVPGHPTVSMQLQQIFITKDS